VIEGKEELGWQYTGALFQWAVIFFKTKKASTSQRRLPSLDLAGSILNCVSLTAIFVALDLQVDTNAWSTWI
jgi:hypothetical protein